MIGVRRKRQGNKKERREGKREGLVDRYIWKERKREKLKKEDERDIR